MNGPNESQSAPIITPRRSFFRLCLSEALGLLEAFQGRPQMRLSDLEQVPDAIVRQMQPVLNPHRPIEIRQGTLVLEDPAQNTLRHICDLDDTDTCILRYFDGQHTLESIGEAVSKEFRLEPEAAYLKTKTLFMTLAKHVLCFPAQQHDAPASDV